MRLIDADSLKDFFFLETSGTEETIRDLMMQHNLDYANDVNEDEVMDFAKGLLKKVCNVIDTEPTAYDVDKVVEELEKEIKLYENSKSIMGGNDADIEYDGAMKGLGKAIEIVKQGLKEQK